MRLWQYLSGRCVANCCCCSCCVLFVLAVLVLVFPWLLAFNAKGWSTLFSTLAGECAAPQSRAHCASVAPGLRAPSEAAAASALEQWSSVAPTRYHSSPRFVNTKKRIYSKPQHPTEPPRVGFARAMDMAANSDRRAMH